MRQKKTTWPDCDICGKPVPTDDGYLCITWARINAIMEERREWGTREPKVIRLSDIPERTPDWRWGHADCLPENDYWIEAKRIDTMQKAFAWTLHLLGKVWFGDTDWHWAIRRLYEVGDA